MQELDQFVSARSNFTDCFGLRHGGKMHADVMHAASGRPDDVIEPCEVSHEQRFRARGVGFEAGVAHWLAAAGLVGWIGDVEAEPLQQFERGDPDFGEEGVDEAGNEQSDSSSLKPFPTEQKPLHFLAGFARRRRRGARSSGN